MKIYKAKNLFKETDERLKEHMDEIIEKIDFLGTIVGKKNIEKS